MFNIGKLYEDVSKKIPRYGKWGGPGYSGGNKNPPEDPIDQMDKDFKKHDYRFGRQMYDRGNRELLDKLRKLPQDPTKWDPPAPNPGFVKWYRDIAKRYFKEIVEGLDEDRENFCCAILLLFCNTNFSSRDNFFVTIKP